MATKKGKPTKSKAAAGTASAGDDEPMAYCSMPVVPVRPLPVDIDPIRREATLESGKRWANGTELRYYFFDRETDGANVRYTDGTVRWASFVGRGADQNVVRAAFDHWAQQGIGLGFQEVQEREDAELRIGFLDGGGSWSYIGTDNVRFSKLKNPGERTMNFGWSLTDGQRGRDTALYEIGHAIGMPHEHQNPKAGIVWDEPKVIEYFGRKPNSWKADTTRHNILDKLPVDEILGSNWDPDSIMHYQFAPGLIISPEPYNERGIRPRPGLSAHDIAWVRQFHPPLSAADYRAVAVNRSELLEVEPKGQVNFTFVPTETRDYTLQLFGDADCTMTLFEKESDLSVRFRAGADDAGTPDQARIRIRLQRGREYIVRVAMHYSPKPEDTAFMVT